MRVTWQRERSRGKKISGSQLLLFLKAVFVFSGRCGRCSRRDSFLSFQSLLAEATFPSGKVIRSVTHLVPACRLRPGCQSGLPWVDLRPRTAHALLPVLREPENIQCQSVFIQCVRTCGSLHLPVSRPTSRGLTAWSNHHKILSPWATPAAAGAGRPAGSIQFCWLGCPDPLAGSRQVSLNSVFLPGPKTRAAS